MHIPNSHYIFNLTDKHQIILKGKSQMDNPEKLAASGTQDEDKQKKNTTQYTNKHN